MKIKPNNKMIKIAITFTLSFILSSFPVIAFAAHSSIEPQRYYFDHVEKTDKRFCPETSTDEGDSDSEFSVGRFMVSGYSRMTNDKNDNLVFLKNVGDKVELSFILNKNINQLNGDDTKSIAYVKDGKDDWFGYSEANFGQGLLLIKYTNEHNDHNTVPYINYLKGVQVGANTKVETFEEGDYEISLDYCISDGFAPFGISEVGGHKILPRYDYYRIHFCFSVRNGNCMVYPFDVLTKSELTNCSYTENGFYLDLANSKYLNIDVKKQLLNNTKDGLIEDTRFNKPSYDGASFTDEGIYEITVSNQYTNSKTVKVIYVGKDNFLKAYANYYSTGTTIKDINKLISEGATISDTGIISTKVVPLETVEYESDELSTNEYETNIISEDNNTQISKKSFTPFLIVGVAIVFLVIILFFIKKHNSKKKKDVYEDINSN